MKTKVVLVLVVLVLAVISLLGYFLFRPETVSVGVKDAGRVVALSKGDILEVSLAGNVTTGFVWEALPMNPALLEQVGEPTMKPETSAVGSGGVIVLRFRATEKGQTELKLVYRRPWEKEVKPLETFEIKVVVN